MYDLARLVEKTRTRQPVLTAMLTVNKYLWTGVPPSIGQGNGLSTLRLSFVKSQLAYKLGEEQDPLDFVRYILDAANCGGNGRCLGEPFESTIKLDKSCKVCHYKMETRISPFLTLNPKESGKLDILVKSTSKTLSQDSTVQSAIELA